MSLMAPPESGRIIKHMLLSAICAGLAMYIMCVPEDILYGQLANGNRMFTYTIERYIQMIHETIGHMCISMVGIFCSH